MDADSGSRSSILEMTTQIVSAYVSNNEISADDLPRLIEAVHSALCDLQQPQGGLEAKPELKPAVPIRKSITNDHIVCLEDGKKFKSLKRHLRTRYEMSPEQYREKWGLPPDYPMVAPAYARQRSDLARQMGLGQAKK